MSEVMLYRNAKDKPITFSSYSARQDFKFCPRKFELTRIKGYQDKEKRAAPLFGTAVESSVRFFEENNRKPGCGVEHFARLWHDITTLPEFDELKYTDSEGDWESLLRSGKELLRLYEIRAPFLPISTEPKAVFQQTLRKKIFPNSEYDILENKAIIDILSFPNREHPLLSEVDPEDCQGAVQSRPLIIDMKTSGDDLDTGLVSLDPQLCEYAWQARIPDVGFLWFVKHGHSLKKGSRVTALENIGNYKAGTELFVLSAGYEKVEIESKTGKPKFEYKPDGTFYVGSYTCLSAYDFTLKGLRGKARDEAEEYFLKEKEYTVNKEYVIRCPETALTKQRLQFAAVRLTQQDMDEIGRDVAQTTVEMVRAHNEQYYPRTGGIRFPNNKCPFCAMRWICLNDDENRDRYLTRKGEEWLDADYEEN